jgi:flagellar protein FliO/FliZ
VLEMVLRIGFSLMVVFAIMWGLAKVVRKPLAGRAGAALAVVGRQQLTRGASVAVVRVADRTLIVGVTESQVTLLGETDASALERPADEPVREPIALTALTATITAATPTAATPTAATPTAAHTATVPAAAAAPTGAAPAPAPVGGPADPAAGALAGSVLSPSTWTQTVQFLRDRTVRR